jgi:hypothetical protein
VLPGSQLPSPSGASQAPAPSAGTAPAAAAPKKAAAPPVITAATEDKLIDRPLKRNGMAGEATLRRVGTGYGLKLSVEGFLVNNLTEPCAVSFGDAPLALTSMGKPAGSPRYRLEAPICPIVFDILNGSILVSEPAQPCVIEAAACRVDMRGLWGAAGASLIAQTKEHERALNQANRAVRENYRLLLARAERNDQRIIAREQAGFSSERELACRDFAREAAHGFCHARFTEARATELRRRMTGRDEPAEAKSRPRPKPKPATAPPTNAIQ